jgi:phosphatidylserine decarboxylase
VWRLAPGVGRFALPLLVAALPAAVLGPPVGAALVALGAAVVWFYRDPERTPPASVEGRTAGGAAADAGVDAGTGVVLAPCDGHVSVVREEGEGLRVGTFMSPADVHVTRAPVAGTVTDVEHVAGGHWPAFSKESDRNERLHVRLRADGDDADATVETTMIAGAFARRITSYVGGDERLAAGQRVGHIAFGSRTDVRLPDAERADLRVSVGDRVRAGETVLAVVG